MGVLPIHQGLCAAATPSFPPRGEIKFAWASRARHYLICLVTGQTGQTDGQLADVDACKKTIIHA